MEKMPKSQNPSEQTNAYQIVVEAISRAINLPTSIWILDDETQSLKIKAAVGLTKKYQAEAFLPLSVKTVTGDAYLSGELVYVPDVLADTRWKYKDFAGEMGWKSALCIPIKVGENVSGVVSIYTYVVKEFSDLEKQLLSSYSVQIGLTLEAEKRRKIFRRLIETGEVFEQLVTGESKQVLQHVVEGACDVTGADCAVVYPYDPDRQDFYDRESVAKIGLNTPLHPTEKPRKDSGMAAYIRRLGEVTIENIEVEDPKMFESPFIKREGIKAFMGIALLVTDRVLGVLYVNYRSTHHFSAEEKDSIRVFANQAAVAIDNARLYQQLTKRVEVLRKLHDIGTGLLSAPGKTFSIIAILQNIVDNAKEVLEADIVSLYEYMQSKNNFRLPPVERGTILNQLPPKNVVLEDDIIWDVIKSRQPVFNRNVQVVTSLTKEYSVPRPDRPKERYVVREKILSNAIIPLIVGSEIVGVMFVNYRTEQDFSPEQRELIEIFAAQAAIAIRNARLLEVNQALYSLGLKLTEGLRLNELDVLEVIHEQADLLMDTNNMYVALYDEGTDLVHFGLAFIDGKRVDLENTKGWQPRKAGGGRTEEIIRTKKPLLHLTKAEAEAWYAQEGHLEVVGQISSCWLGVPMIVRNKVIGMIATFGEKEYLYNEDDQIILQSISNHAAIAIENSHLYYDVNKRLHEMIKFGLDVSGEIHLDEEKILELIYAKASELMTTANMYIALYDKATDFVRFGLAYVGGKRIDTHSDEKWQPRKAGGGRTEEVIRKKYPLFHNTKKEAEDWYRLESHTEYIGTTFSAWLGVPMLIGNKVVGVIATYDPDHENAFSTNDLEFLQGMANQAAVALENARLYEETLAMRDQMIADKQIATLGIATAALQHRFNNTLNIIPPNLQRLRSRVNLSDPTIQEILDIIERNIGLTSNLIKRIQEPLKNVEIEDVNINSILDEVVDKVKRSWNDDHTHPLVEPQMHLEDPIPIIRASIGQITEVFNNLVDNGYRAMQVHGGKLIVSSQLVEREIQVRIQDTGTGIPPSIQQRLFEKPVPSKGPHGGSGLGLWLSKLILQALGGSITIERTGLTGTTMLVTIPVKGEEAVG